MNFQSAVCTDGAFSNVCLMSNDVRLDVASTGVLRYNKAETEECGVSDMRKQILLWALLGMLCVLSGCAAEQSADPKMYIEAAKLTAQEEKLSQLLGIGDAHQLIYDFVIDERVKHVGVSTYRLLDGAWVRESGGGGTAFTAPKGRLALGFECVADGLRVALQSENGTSATSHETHTELDFTGMGRSTSMSTERTEIQYETEIPLVIQSLTTKNEHVSIRPDAYFTPGELEALGYEYVYAVTVTFSAQELR